MNMTLRIIIAFFFVMGGGFYYFLDQISGDIRHRYQEVLEESINDQAHLLASLIEEDLEHGRPYIQNLNSLFFRTYARKFYATIYDLEKRSVNLRIYVTDQKGIVLYDSIYKENVGKDFSRWNDVFLTLRGKYGARSTKTNPDDPYSGAIFVAAPILKDGELAGVLTVSKPKDSIVTTVSSARLKLFRIALLVSVSMIVTFLLFFFWITTPVHRLTRYVHQLRQNKRAPLPRLGNSEFRELGQAFEMMRSELEGRRYIEQYIQTLTHEIKSPLTSIMGAAELLDEDMSLEKRRRFIRNIRSESARIEDIVGRLLHLASIENRNSLREIKDIHICSLLEELSAGFEPELEKKGLRIEVSCLSPLVLSGEEFLIKQALSNLLQNAVNFADSNSTILVSASTNEEEILIVIQNTGEAIPDFATGRIFEKFYSLPGTSNRKSTGLGLPFVREVAQLHGGRVQVQNVENGVAARFTLPVKQPET